MLAIQLPARWVPWYSRIVNGLFWAVVGGWLALLALWMVVHGFIVPRIEDFRPWLQERASATLGHRVVIGTISAKSHRWVPEFVLGDIQLLDEQGQTRLALDRVTLSLTPTSLVQGEFSQITLEALDLEVVRDAQGRIRVAGIPLQDSQDDRLRNWVFAQWEWVLRDSTVHWTDEARGQATVSWHHLEAVLRNGLRDHRFRIDLSPEPHWGERLSVRGQFRQPLLSNQPGRWEDWSGQAHVQASQLNLAPWSDLIAGEPGRLQGRGWARAWLEVREGQLHDWTADVHFSQVDLMTGAANDRAHWRAAELRGRWAWVGGDQEKWTLQNALVVPHDAPGWPIGQASMSIRRDRQGRMTSGTASIDRVELASLRAWAHLAPTEWQARWLQAAPQGRLQQVQWQWSGSWDNLQLQDWQAQFNDLSLQAGSTRPGHPVAGWPGISGLSGKWSGRGLQLMGPVQVQDGQLSWPGVWDGPARPISQFKADLEAAVRPEGLMLKVKGAQLLLDQARADWELDWSNTPSDPLGQLHLRADVPQASVAQIVRWLPLSLPDGVRQYVKTAITQGEVRHIKAKVAGRLQDFPFSRAGSGEFRIGGQLSKVRYQTVPRGLMDSRTAGEWPLLQDLSGELVFSGGSLQLSQVKARLSQAPNIAWSRLEAKIRQLDDAVVEIQAEGKGPAAEALTLWRGSPLHPMTDRVLEGTRASGLAEYKMSLSIPLAKPDQTQAKGSVNWLGNDVVMAPGAPALSRLRGALAFTESGFDLSGVQASLWGGEVRLEGGTKGLTGALAPTARIKAMGELSAQGLRAAPELSDWAAHLKKIQGTAPYQAQLQWRRGQLETLISSDLVGLSIQAPSGLGKSAAEPLPLRWESSLTAETAAGAGVLQEQISLRLGAALEARYLRDLSGSQPKVLRGLIRWGSRTPNTWPAQGVALRVQSEAFNLDEWSDWMQPFTGQPATGGGWDFAPQRLEFQSGLVTAQNRQLNQVSLTAQRNGESWQGQVRTRELEGDLAYQPSRGPEPARLQARLARLTVPANASTDPEPWLDNPVKELPTLDIQIRELELKGKKLGALELLAQNRLRPDGLREWQLSKLLISNEDGHFQADGLWRKLPAQSNSQTSLDFKWTVKNAGAMMHRLGLPDAIRNGNGSLSGKITWSGSPISPAVGSMNGQFKVDIERGQFLKTEPGAARLLGVLSLQSLPRRLMLDFRDVFSEGFAFDFFRGDIKIEQGLASSQNQQMKGGNVAVLMEGQANVAQETQDIKVLVIPDINAGGASLVYSAINPVVGLTTFLAQYVLRRPLMETNTQQFHVDGTWSEPRVTQVPFKSDAKP